jgi:hypothetical protein
MSGSPRTSSGTFDPESRPGGVGDPGQIAPHSMKASTERRTDESDSPSLQLPLGQSLIVQCAPPCIVTQFQVLEIPWADAD